jgi:uncharacterized membrane protein YfcA
VEHVKEAFGTLVGAVLLAVGLFALFVGIGLVTHLVFLVVLKPEATPGYVVGTAVAATLIVAAAALILWAFGVRLSHLPAWIRRRRARRASGAAGVGSADQLSA